MDRRTIPASARFLTAGRDRNGAGGNAPHGVTGRDD